MVNQEFAKGDKDLGIILAPKYYNFKQFVGSNFGIPLKAYDSDIAKRLITISTFERADGKKLKKAEILPQLFDILENCQTLGVDKLLVCNSDYFKALTNQKGFEDAIGMVYDCVLEGYTDVKVMPCINPAVLSAQPNKKPLLDRALATLGAVLTGTYVEPKAFEFEYYELITEPLQARAMLKELLQYPLLASDIEATGLRVGEAEVLTIAFAWGTHSAVTLPLHEKYGSSEIIPYLLEFFEEYQGSIIWHNCLYDLKQLIFNYYMKDFNNLQGLYDGCDKLGVDRCHDTMLLAYAELNSTERPPLGLKVLAKEFLGDWGLEEVKDCNGVPLDTLAEYNAKDTCATFWLYEKYKHQITSRIYQEILQPSVEPLLHMMCNGLPIDLNRVDEASEIIVGELEKAEETLKRDSYVDQAVAQLKETACLKYNMTHKKQKESWEFDLEFNPGSPTQLRVLLYDVMGFEPIEFTETNLPKTDRASLKEFKSLLPEDDDRRKTLDALQAISETAIIQNTFLSAFKEMSLEDATGQYTLHGNLRLGGTQSGRLSSSEPNLQNMPSGSAYGKAIKNCFVAPKGWLFAYSDFSALEDRIGAILSKDKNKTKEFLQDFDGHSLRCNAFFPEELEALGLVLDPNEPKSINRIKDEAEALRNKSKPISFLKQYGGGASKIQKVLKCSQQRAVEISDAYDELYAGQIEFQKTNELFCKQHGYIELAFGLQLKTPRIHSKDNGVQSSEVRSSSNAATQSYGMLMNRAFIEFLDRLKASEFKNDVKLINTIHDAVYLLIREDAEVIKWVNDNLVDCMLWQEDPKLESEIKMGAELDLGRDWAHCYTLPNGFSEQNVALFLSKLDGDVEDIKKFLKEAK